MNNIGILFYWNLEYRALIMTKVSVIVPIYNVEKYLPECIESILNQTLTDLEIILVDDGSKDNSPQICDEYAKKDSRIKVLHKINGGYGSAINAGLDIASGEYIGIVESDDFIEPKMYEDYYNLAVENNVEVVKGAYYEISEDAQIQYIPNYLKKFSSIPQDAFHITNYPHILNHHASIWSGIYQREFLRTHAIKMFEKNKGRYADQVWRFQTLLLAKNICWTHTPYYKYRVFSANNTTATKGAKTPDDILDLYLELNKFFHKHNDLYESVKEYYFYEIYTHTLFNLKRCDKQFAKYILEKFKEEFATKIPIDIVENSKILSKKEKSEFKAMLNGTFYPKYLMKNLFENIFSLTNARDKSYKIITICGLKFQIKKRIK